MAVASVSGSNSRTAQRPVCELLPLLPTSSSFNVSDTGTSGRASCVKGADASLARTTPADLTDSGLKSFQVPQNVRGKHRAAPCAKQIGRA